MPSEELKSDHEEIHSFVRWTAIASAVGAIATFFICKLAYLDQDLALRSASAWLVILGGVNLTVSLRTMETYVVHRRLIQFGEMPFTFSLTVLRDVMLILFGFLFSLGILGSPR